MRKNLISVITIFLNGERFLREAIGSVLSQTYQEWELLLVDDGSTDGSTQISLEYRERFPHKIRYLEHQGHENRGMSASRNLGTRLASGEYIAFLDADDIWTPEKLERQFELLHSRKNADMVYGPAQWWYSWTGEPDDRRRDFIQEFEMGKDVLVHPPHMFSVFLRNQLNLPLPSALLIRRNAVERVGGFEERFRGMYEDQAFLSKFFLKSTVFVSGECWLKYRQHPDACCASETREGRYHQARFFFLSWLENYLCSEGILQTEILSAVRKQLWPYRHPRLNRMLQPLRRQARRARRILQPSGS